MSSSRTVQSEVSLCPISHSQASLILPILFSRPYCDSLALLDFYRNCIFRTWALDVADNASGGVVHELNSDLGNTSTGT